MILLVFSSSLTYVSIFFIKLNNFSVFYIQALSKALTELRADMVQQAQDDVKAHAESQAIEKNIQKIVDKQTRELQVINFRKKHRQSIKYHL